MKKKKLLSVLLAGAMSASIFVGCGSSATDWDYISNKGELVIGVTYFEPMNYLDADGKLTGFETEFAEAVCEKMGVTPKFQKIDWDSKEVELNSKTIDCIWNGLTIDDDRKSTMDISTPYMENKQVMVAKSDVADKIKSADDLKDKTVVAEVKLLLRQTSSSQVQSMFQLTHRLRLFSRLSQAQQMLRLSTM